MDELGFPCKSIFADISSFGSRSQQHSEFDPPQTKANLDSVRTMLERFLTQESLPCHHQSNGMADADTRKSILRIILNRLVTHAALEFRYAVFICTSRLITVNKSATRSVYKARGSSMLFHGRKLMRTGTTTKWYMATKTINECQFRTMDESGFKTDLIKIWLEKFPWPRLCSRSPLRISDQNRSFDLDPSRPNACKVSSMLYDENRYGKEGNKFSKNSGICFDVIGFLRSPVTIKKADSYLSWNIPRFQVSRLRPVIQRRMEYFL